MYWTIGWLAWIGWFAVEEGLALFRGTTADTLSGHLWHWFAVGGNTDPTALQRVRRFALIAGLAWLAAHLVTGGTF